jgi:hypothetical protein
VSIIISELSDVKTLSVLYDWLKMIFKKLDMKMWTGYIVINAKLSVNVMINSLDPKKKKIP